MNTAVRRLIQRLHIGPTASQQGPPQTSTGKPLLYSWADPSRMSSSHKYDWAFLRLEGYVDSETLRYLHQSKVSGPFAGPGVAEPGYSCEGAAHEHLDGESEVHMSRVCPLDDNLLPIAADGLRLKQVIP